MLESLLFMKKRTELESGTVLAGTLEHGWFGEVSSEEMITGDELASRIGLTAGVSQHSDAGWLKFSLDNQTLYVAKRAFRHSISWNQLNNADLVFGNKTVTINGRLYKVRLLKGRDDGLTTSMYSGGYDLAATAGSEWNRLMYHVSGKPFVDVNNKLTSEGIEEGDWVSITESGLLVHNSHGYGTYCYVQELTSNGEAVSRGGRGVSYISSRVKSTVDAGRGWRPCLELVP